MAVETDMMVNPVDPLVTTVENETASSVGDVTVVGESIAAGGEGEFIEGRVNPADSIDVVEE